MSAFRVREHVRWSDVDVSGLIRWDAYTRFVELAETEIGVGRIGASSIRLDFAMRASELKAEGSLTIVALGRKEGRSIAVPEPLVRALDAYRV